MIAVSNDYKSTIKQMGREISVVLDIIDYDDEGNIVNQWTFDDQYTTEKKKKKQAGPYINSISISYDGQLYKSIMKQCIIDINKDVYPAETGTSRELDVSFGVLVDDEYEYIDLGQFLIKEIQEQKDTLSYRITAYDRMLLSMTNYNGVDFNQYVQTTDTNYLADKDYYIYTQVDGEYIYKLLVVGTDYDIGDAITGTKYELEALSYTLREYISIISSHLGLSFYNINDTFPNYDKVLTKDLYVDSEGASLGYTFRDILDDIAEATGRTFIINGSLRLIATPTTSVATIDEESFKDINVEFGEKYGPINKLSLTRSADSDVIYKNDETSIQANGETELAFRDNQLLSQDDREEWIDEIFNEIKGTEYYLNDYSSTGITYLEPLDRYEVSIGDNTYSCIMMADEINITQGLEENVHSDRLDGTKTDYATSSTSDKVALQTTLIVNKQLGQIVGEVATKTDLSNLQGQVDANGNAIENLGTRVTQTESNITFTTNTLNKIVDKNGNVTSVKNSLVTIDADGIQVQTNTSVIKTQMTNDAFIISDTTGELARFDDDGANLDNLSVDHYLTMGVHRVEKYDNNTRTGFFYVGG